MAKKQYTDAEGNIHEVDDEATLLGPNPPQSPEAETPRYQLIQYVHTGGSAKPTPKHDPHNLGPQPMSDAEKCKDASNSGLNDPAYLKLMEGKQ